MANNHDKIQVLIVEDSIVEQELLKHLINSDPRLQVAHSVTNAMDALHYLQSNTPDVISVDIHLPGMDGYELTKTIMRNQPIPIVIISGHYSKTDVEKSFKSIEAGAVSILEKPTNPDDPEFSKKSEEIRNYLTMAARTNPKKRTLVADQEVSLSKLESDRLVKCVVIGGSLGGPQALKTILSKLPKNFPVPIFIVQHISSGFAKGMVEWLKKDSHLDICLGEHLQKGHPGVIYLAPDNYHMMIDSENVIHLDAKKGPREIQPSVSKLFASAAAAHGPKSVAVILTGMGADGAQELLLLKQKGAVTIAQDENSCVIFGMPKVAIELGAATYVTPLEDIPDRIVNSLKIKQVNEVHHER